MRYWLFYAGPENYLSDQGERDFSNTEWVWSGPREATQGDLALLYRKSLSRLSANEMAQSTGMPMEKAEELKRRGIGSDIPALWQVTTGDQGALGPWQSSSAVRQLAKIEPPITLSELKANRQLKKWRDLQWNFQAQGRDALEIPEFAWIILKKIISERIGRPFEQLTL